jgi:hypothetical protein
VKQVKQSAFAAMYVHQKQPHIMSWTIAGSPFTVRERVGKQWCAEDPKNGWKAARIEGVKVVKVTLTANC